MCQHTLCGVYTYQVHKKLGNTHLALMNFSWANDLDPKGANNQIKEAIDKPYHTDDDDPTAGERVLDKQYSFSYITPIMAI